MALTVETGIGVSGAESYASTAGADAYWAGRSHAALSAIWTPATTAQKEGALREASTYADARWGAFYKGQRRGYIQGLLWPRSGALDEAGYPLPDLPDELVRAACELAARALSATLSSDAARGGMVASERVKAGSVEEQTQFFEGTTAETKFGVLVEMLGPVLNGTQGGVPSWNWM